MILSCSAVAEEGEHYMYIDVEKYKIWLKRNYDTITNNAVNAYKSGMYADAMSLFIEAQAYESILAAIDDPMNSGIQWIEKSELIY